MRLASKSERVPACYGGTIGGHEIPQNLKVPASGKKDMHGAVAIFKLLPRFSDFVLPKFLLAAFADFFKDMHTTVATWGPQIGPTLT